MKGGDRYVYRHFSFSCNSCIWRVVILRQIQKADHSTLPELQNTGQLPDKRNLSGVLL